MKFTNLVVPVHLCDLGEIVRISRTQSIVQIVEKSVFSVKVKILSGTGYATLPFDRNVHRKLEV